LDLTNSSSFFSFSSSSSSSSSILNTLQQQQHMYPLFSATESLLVSSASSIKVEDPTSVQTLLSKICVPKFTGQLGDGDREDDDEDDDKKSKRKFSC
jgi:hypothetical protein